ncbi:MAG TPA: non-ribosomal peptide synthetase [Steroidobacteraceae bacterium]|jgi:acyl-CoA synthetase (AMP-forming)/AMP-acid ligase II/acyl carrier protein|nr:non-ribosomal peptide synthetase [Steroidobacteraceae bacterium]
MTIIKYQTLPEMLDERARGDGAIVYLEGEGAEKRLTLANLRRRALGILHHLQRAGARPGDFLILHVPSNEQFIDAYWACLYGGVVPVPVAVGISDEHKHKLLRIAKLLGTPLLYTDRKLHDRLAAFAEAQDESSTWRTLGSRTFLTDSLDDISQPGTPAALTADQTAFIQFSSGSTSEPKGVVLTHRNILANAEGARQAAGFSEDDVSLSWMPLTHDMGLIGFHLMMMYSGVRQHLMPTDLFVRRALLWLKWCSEKRVTLTCSPNFGYRHCLRALGDKTLDAHDLSSVRLIFNGAEPISVELAEEFLDRLAPYGLPRTAMYPVYGLAEASLAVSFPKPGSMYRYVTVDRRSLAVGTPARLVEPTDPTALKLMCEGTPIAFTSVKLVDDAGAEVPAGAVGHLLMRGDNVTQGYFRNPEANAAAITADGWLRTGDLALEHEGELYVTGRSKEIIFVNGQNYYPHDLEALLQAEAGLELGKVVATGARGRDGETDELVLFVLHRGSVADFLPLATRAMHLVNEHAGVEVARVVAVKRIPKTTSGKLQRTALAQAYEDGEFAAEMAEFDRAWAESHGHGRAAKGRIERELKAIVDDAMPGKHVDIDDNLFDVGASSLTLLQVHEKIDALYPNAVDLTELFDYPTISQLAKHLEEKLVASG